MEETPRILDRRRAVVLAAAAVVLAAAAFAGLGTVASFGRIRDAVARADLPWLALTPVGLALNYAGFVGAWRTVAHARGGPEIGWWQSLRIVLLRTGATLLVGGGALAVDGWALHRAGAELRDVVRRVLALDFARFASLGVVGGVAAAVTYGVGERVPRAFVVGWLAGLAVLVAIALAPSPRLRLRRKALADAAGAVALARELLRDPWCYPGTALGLPLFWAGNGVVVVAAVRALGIGLSVGQVVLAYATAQLLLVAPLPVGASGGYEATLAWLLTRFGAPLAAALPAAFLFRLAAFWLPAAIAFASGRSLLRLPSELPSPEPPRAARRRTGARS